VQATLTHKIQVPNQLLDSNACVSELINYDDNWQNVPMIESLFPADVVEQSCSMATSPHITRINSCGVAQELERSLC